MWISPSDIKIRIGLKNSLKEGTDILDVLIIVRDGLDITPVESNSQDSVGWNKLNHYQFLLILTISCVYGTQVTYTLFPINYRLFPVISV